MARKDSESPVRGRGSPRRRSPSRKERSPAQHRSSHKESTSVEEKSSSRKRSPRSKRSRSPVSLSPVREKHSSHARSPNRRKSVSPETQSPDRGRLSTRGRSPKRKYSVSPVSRSPEARKPSSHVRSPKHTKSRSPEHRSASPRSKRLRRVQADRGAEKMSDREASKNHRKRGGRAVDEERDLDRELQSRRVQNDKGAEKINEREAGKNHRRRGNRGIDEERDLDRELPRERKGRKSGRDDINNGNSRSRLSMSPSDRHRHHVRHRSRSPSGADDRARNEVASSREAEHRNGADNSIAKMKAAESALEAKEKQKPSFELSGKLAAETNRVRGVTLLFSEPPDARKPSIRWRLYIFKAGEVLNEPLYIHRQSCYLFGRERRVADIPTDHPSCSKQHAVLQYRQVEKENPDGASSKQVVPYLMDLGSTNGTFINDNRIEPQRYYELFEKDTIKFGNSSREYVLLHENSAG